MAFGILAEALARIEHKLDALLIHTHAPIYPMYFQGVPCPACMKPIEYTVDITHGVVVRRCDCKTGKVAATMPLTPVQNVPGERNGNAAAVESGLDTTENRPRRKSR